VGILISNKLVYNIKKYSRDLNDNILIIDITIAGFSLTLGAVYGPNEDDEFFFQQIERFCNDIGNSEIILGGDWN
jgi:uncharacterized protein (UPF0303 family)